MNKQFKYTSFPKVLSARTLLKKGDRLFDQTKKSVFVESELIIDNLSISFFNGETNTKTVNGVSYSVKRGESLGVVGESGSGKSITWLAALGLLPKNAVVQGSARFGNLELINATRNELQTVRGAGIGMIFQDPVNSLNPVRKISSQLIEVIRLNCQIDYTRAEAEALRLLDQVGIYRPKSVMVSYPHELSGGMSQRVMIAMALSARPSFLIADEPTTALDVTTQAQILKLIDDLQSQMNMGLIFISHDLDVVASVCSRVVVMESGCIVEDQPTELLFSDPIHNTTRRLIKAMPKILQPGLTSLSIASQGDRFEGQEEQTAFTNPLVRLDSVTKSYVQANAGRIWLPSSKSNRSQVVVESVSFDIHEGTTFGLVGESGSGKSTIGQLVLGYLPTTSGTIQFDGTPISSNNPKRLMELRRFAQLIPQDPSGALDKRWTIGAQIEEPLEIFGLEKSSIERRKQCLKIMRRIGLEENLYNRYPSQLSGGQRQRVVLARALITRPRLIVCDEVTSALDVSVQAQVLDLLKELQEQYGLTYLFITHDLRVVSRLAHQVAVLQKGKIVEIAPPSKLFEKPTHPYTQKLVQSIPRIANAIGAPSTVINSVNVKNKSKNYNSLNIGGAQDFQATIGKLSTEIYEGHKLVSEEGAGL